MAIFDPGRLNRLVRLQQQTTETDAAGQPLRVWADVASVWADIRLPNGLETIKAGAVVSVVQASIRVRYRTDVHAGLRVVHGATVYEILAVLPDVAGRRFLDLACQVAA